jgi:DNA-binding IclR family transcriptional regulator
MGKETKPNRIKTSETIFDIINCVRENELSTVTGIADQSDTSKSTVHAHLHTLCDLGYLVEEDGSYRLGLPFLTLGGDVQQTGLYGKLYRISKPEIDELTETTGERAQIVVEENGYGFYLYQSLGDRAVQADTFIGSRTPLHSTAAGKVFLAYISNERAEEIINRHGLSADTDDTITDRDQLYERLDRIQERGYAFDREERIPGICCVAAPVMAQDTVYGSVSVSLPRKRSDEEFFQQRLPDLVTSAAQVISLNAKYS